MASLASSMSGSRSPSPDTPEADTESMLSTGDLQNWLKPAALSSWDIDPALLALPEKDGEPDMMRLDELIECNAYQDSATEPYALHAGTNTSAIPFTIPAHPLPILSRRPAPIPTAPKTVFPLKESCYNLPIMFPSIPETGVKSRVETQIRTTVELADASTSADPHRYDRVGSWKWLRLPQGTASKRRSRKAQQLSADPDDTLSLSVSVTCSSPPHNGVLSCTSCQNREAKRVAKKLASRVKPKRGDAPVMEPAAIAPQEDTTSIIQFNCPEVVDFSTGSVVLPLRITCYCRHHREKVGFNVHFTMLDSMGRIVGAGSTRPIMITDDHKTSGSSKPAADLLPSFGMMDLEWAQVGSSMDVHNKPTVAPSKRKAEGGTKRPRPYDSLNHTSPSQASTSPSVSIPASPFRTPSPAQPSAPETSHSSPLPQLSSSQDSESSESVMTPVDFPSPGMPLALPPTDLALGALNPLASMNVQSHPHPMSHIFFDFNDPAPPVPTIHRLIPNCGPTHGGIEVTILGANFLPSFQLTCMFGDVPASSTQRWSDNTLVCVLPPRATPGVVAVWFEGQGIKIEGSAPSQPPTLFTYSDESDRALMELALQVVGLKMTGKIEDAKNIAMKIVAGDSSEQYRSNGSSNFQGTTQRLSSATRESLPLLLLNPGESKDMESRLVDLLSIIDTPLEGAPVISTAEVLSRQTPNGQTMLHLAAFLGMKKVVQFLLAHDIDQDVRDRNGYTALHFAAFVGSAACVGALVDANADEDIVNNLGKTAEEIAVNDCFGPRERSENSDTETDEEAQWGDGEEDASAVVPKRNRAHKKQNRQTSQSPVPPPFEKQIDEKEQVVIDEKHLAQFLVEIIQRGLAQLPGGPQLPLDHLPRLPQMPGVPGAAAAWNVLPQIPVAFPVFVPGMPPLSTLLGKDSKARATWENWVAASMGEKATGQTATVVEDDEDLPAEAETDRRQTRRVAPDASMPEISAQEVDAYEYQPRSQHQHRKQDKMLIMFWIPILFLSMLWALHHGFTFALRAIRTAAPLRHGLKG